MGLEAGLQREEGRIHSCPYTSCPISVLAHFCSTTNRSLSICSKHALRWAELEIQAYETWAPPLEVSHVLRETDLGTMDSHGVDQVVYQTGTGCV